MKIKIGNMPCNCYANLNKDEDLHDVTICECDCHL